MYILYVHGLATNSGERIIGVGLAQPNYPRNASLPTFIEFEKWCGRVGKTNPTMSRPPAEGGERSSCAKHRRHREEEKASRLAGIGCHNVMRVPRAGSVRPAAV